MGIFGSKSWKLVTLSDLSRKRVSVLSLSQRFIWVSFYNITKGKFKLASQIVKVGDNGMHVFVNDWDINNWNMFMYVGNWQPKLRGHHFKGNIYPGFREPPSSNLDRPWQPIQFCVQWKIPSKSKVDLWISSVAKVHFNTSSDIILEDLWVSWKHFVKLEIMVLDLETTVGLSTGTQIPPFKDAWQVPMALLGPVSKLFLGPWIPGWGE